MIEIHRVTKQFFNLKALDEVSLEIKRGQVLGVLGPNGAGKTTLFKLIIGFLRPDGGAIRPQGGNWPVIGYKPERLLFPAKLKVADYMRLIARLSTLPPGESVHQAVQRTLIQVRLTDLAGKRLADCSKGMRQRVGLAQALIGDPALILLDEPTNGLDPEGQADIQRQIRDLHALGKTVVLSSHQLHEVTAICTDLVIINNGHVLYRNSMSGALQERPHANIVVDRQLEPVRLLLRGLHDDIDVREREVILNREAMRLRRQVLSLLVGAGYDIVEVNQQRVTLAEIYAEAVR